MPLDREVEVLASFREHIHPDILLGAHIRHTQLAACKSFRRVKGNMYKPWKENWPSNQSARTGLRRPCYTELA